MWIRIVLRIFRVAFWCGPSIRMAHSTPRKMARDRMACVIDGGLNLINSLTILMIMVMIDFSFIPTQGVGIFSSFQSRVKEGLNTVSLSEWLSCLQATLTVIHDYILIFSWWIDTQSRKRVYIEPVYTVTHRSPIEEGFAWSLGSCGDESIDGTFSFMLIASRFKGRLVRLLAYWCSINDDDIHSNNMCMREKFEWFH